MEAMRFRNAIEKCDKSLLPYTFDKFPYGSCGDAAPLLGTYLIECGFGEFGYALGSIGSHETNDWHSHAWLQKNNLIVDITADQFPDINDSVLVLINSEWHNNFNCEIEHIADYRIYDENTVSNLGRAYAAIIKCL